jgi:hypothetical protein
LLDLLLSLAESVPTRGSRGSPDSRLTRETFAESVPTRGSPLLSYLLAPREAPPQVEQPGRVLQLPPGEFGKCHSPWRIARAIALNYNLSTYHLIIIIILQEPLFLRDMIKYIQ